MVVNRLYKENILKDAGLRSAMVQKPGEQQKSMFGIKEDDFFIGFDCETKQFVRYFIVDAEGQAEEYLKNNIPVLKRFLNYEFKHCDDWEFQHIYQMYKKEYKQYLEANPLSEYSHFMTVAEMQLSDAELKKAIVQKPGEQPEAMLGIMKDEFFIGYDYKTKQLVRYFTSELITEEPEKYLENNVPVFRQYLDLDLKQYDSKTVKTIYEMYKKDYSDYLQNNLIEKNHTLDKVLEFSNNIAYATYLNYAMLNDEKCLMDNGYTRAFSLLRHYSDGSFEACPLEFLRPEETCNQYWWYPRLENLYNPADNVFVFSAVPLDFTRMTDYNINYIYELCTNYKQYLANEEATQQKVREHVIAPQ